MSAGASPSGIRALVLTLSVLASPACAARYGELEIRVVDQDTGQPVAVRMRLNNARGRSYLPRSLTAWHDHFVLDGKAVLRLPPGQYTFQMHRGPEYRVRTGHFTIEPGATDNTQVDMQRFVNMREAGWWAGDLYVPRPLRDVPLLIRAEDLHVVPVVTWSDPPDRASDRQSPRAVLLQAEPDRFYHLMAGRHHGDGGSLLVFQLDAPLAVNQPPGELPGPLDFPTQARQHPHVHIDLPSPFAWDMPLWVSAGQIDSIGVASATCGRTGRWTRNRARGIAIDCCFPRPTGSAAGQRPFTITCSTVACASAHAGSGSGVQPNPVGYNRVYVHCGKELTYDKWWEGLRGTCGDHQRAAHAAIGQRPAAGPRVPRLPGGFRGTEHHTAPGHARQD